MTHGPNWPGGKGFFWGGGGGGSGAPEREGGVGEGKREPGETLKSKEAEKKSPRIEWWVGVFFFGDFPEHRKKGKS